MQLLVLPFLFVLPTLTHMFRSRYTLHVDGFGFYSVLHRAIPFVAMGRHIAPSEINAMLAWKSAGLDPMAIHMKLSASRRRPHQPTASVDGRHVHVVRMA